MTLQTLYDQVKELLYWEPETRNSDALLTVRLMEKFHGADWTRMTRERMIELLRVVNGESVKRFRAMIQNDPEHPKFLPTNWTVAKMRRWKKDEWKLALGYSTLTPADHIEQYEHEKHMRSIEHEREIVC